MRRVDTAERQARFAIRHHLSPGHRAKDVVDAADGVVALHATDAASIYLSTWARVDDVEVADIDRALYVDRSVVKHLCMRRTLFVFRKDLLGPIQSAVSSRVAATERKRLAKAVEDGGLHDDGTAWLEAAQTATLKALDEAGSATSTELKNTVDLLAGQLIYAPDKSYGGAQSVAPRVLTTLSAGGQVLRGPNRGGWTVSRPTWVHTSTWLGAEPELPDPDDAIDDLVREWLYAFGPGTLNDIKWWFGSTLTIIRASLARIGAVEVQVDSGPAFVLPDDTDEVGPVGPYAALLPGLDPTTMGWFEREWYLGPHKAQVFDRNGNAGATAWWDGRIVGGWFSGPDGEVVLRYLEKVGKAAEAALEAEAARLSAWLGGVRIRPSFPSPLSQTAELVGESLAPKGN